MDRVVVVGPPGAGKTTLARALAARLGCDYIEIDALWWEPGWREVGPEILRERLRPIAGSNRWVVDGNYFTAGSRELLWPVADTVVWLAQPRWVTVPRVLRRSLRRSFTREELWPGNREPFWRLFRPDSIVWFAWTSHPKYRQRYDGLEADPSLAHLSWARLTSPRAVRRWLRSIEPAT